MKRTFQLLLCLCVSAICKAGNGDYSIAKITPALMKEANVIKRYEEIKFEVLNVNKARTYKKVAYTILNEKGDESAEIVEMYDKLSNQPSIEATLYDAMGVKVKSLKRSDIKDMSATDDNNLIDDNRLKAFNFYCKNYPYTVEYEVEQDQYYTMFFPGWIPVEKEMMSVQYSSFSVILPADLHFRYKASNGAGEPVKTTVDNKQVFTWKLQDFNAIKREPYAPYWLELVPCVYMAPSEFAIQGYQGNMNSWQDFGKFVYALKKDRDALPAEVKAKVHELTDNIADTHKKVALLYDFMQKNTRYISVQLGIGGWQPFDATYVATKRYGDCKALSNYMFSLLKEAGIPSCYALVKAKNNSFVADFPSSQFNHAILCVPLAKDTMWLECTSQTEAPGYMGDFTGGHYSLLINEAGGTLVKVPGYKMNDNLQVRKTFATVDATGNTEVHENGQYKAIQQEDLHNLINYNAKDKQLERLKSQFDLPQYDVVSFSYKEEKSRIPVINEDVQLNAIGYASVTGKRLFIMPNILSKSSSKPTAADARKYDLVLDLEYKDVDTVEIKIPDGYIPESVPQPQQIATKFGKYTSSVKIEGNKIYYYRSMERISGRFTAAAYNEFVQFYEQIYKADRSKVVMVKAN
ncbi:DUF3857 domain-containing protein [Pinibacter aurantiacus]|uniref:DUF3857 domain-containing protein n=1 Tax=Pinibacter aurantiacus TaxID=2851599 RepID=A0A9E2SDB2_9BACT|nr:DUF3857 domain-containing protein [Pinibacter aurantiacus]MBV4358430.1 DUF3857 domain-containing protein [Pinibacter aurantiacus]